MAQPDYSMLPPIPDAYAPLVASAAAQYGVPVPILHWVINNESHYDPTAVGIPTSSGQAQGIAQFMPGTAAGLGVNPMDPDSAIPGAAKLLSQNYQKTGSWTGAVEKYGTFSGGRGAAHDQAVRDGFQKMLMAQNIVPTSLDAAAANPPGPSLADLLQQAPPVTSQRNPPMAANGPQDPNYDDTDPSQNPYAPGGVLSANPQPQGGFFGTLNLLRLAAGAGKNGGMNAADTLSGMAGAMADGIAADQQTALKQQGMNLQQRQFGIDQGKLAIEQEQADTEAQKARDQAGYWRGMALDRMGTLIANGVPPALAYKMVSAMMGSAPTPGTAPAVPSTNPGAPGQAPSTAAPDPIQAALANVPGGGRQTKGDLFYAPDGTTFQQMDRVQGPPTFYNLTTNQMVPALPQGSFRAQDSAFRKNNDMDATTYNTALTNATQGKQQNALYQSVLDLAPQINLGGDIGTTLARNFVNFTGGNTAAAQSLAGNLLSQLQVARIKLLGGQGLGPLRQSEIKAVQQAGANWSTQPAALQAIAKYAMAQNDMQAKLVDAWNDPNTDQAQGFRKFAYNFMKDPKNIPSPSDYDGNITGGASQAPGAAAPTLRPTTGQAGGINFTFTPSGQ